MANASVSSFAGVVFATNWLKATRRRSASTQMMQKPEWIRSVALVLSAPLRPFPTAASGPSPRVTGDFTSLDGAAVGPPRAAAAASTLDARGAVSIVLKELDQKDRLIAMLRRQYEEVVMERDHEKEVKDVLIEKVGVYLTCPVTLQEMQAKMLQGVCGHMLSVQAVQGMLRQQGINPFAVEPPYSLPCPLCRQTSLFGPAIGIGPLVEAALEARLPCALPVEPPSNNPMDFATTRSDSD